MAHRQVGQESIQQLPSWRDEDQELGDTFDGQLYLSLIFTGRTVGFNSVEVFWVDRVGGGKIKIAVEGNNTCEGSDLQENILAQDTAALISPGLDPCCI